MKVLLYINPIYSVSHGMNKEIKNSKYEAPMQGSQQARHNQIVSVGNIWFLPAKLLHTKINLSRD